MLTVYLATVAAAAWFWSGAAGHGYLANPPGRGSAWRFGYNTPQNYNDMENFCGGAQVQHTINGGKCGVCGDPYNGERKHEVGGVYATGTITGRYSPGSLIPIHVKLTANHKGYFEFKLCSANDPSVEVTQSCLDGNVLKFADGSTRQQVLQDQFDIYAQIQLPQGLTCARCVLQWRYRAGNTHGVCDDGTSRLGCGAQEEFWNCADIQIGDEVAATMRTSQASTTHTTAAATSKAPSSSPASRTTCRAIGKWVEIPGMDSYCATNCAASYCPADMCACF